MLSKRKIGFGLLALAVLAASVVIQPIVVEGAMKCRKNCPCSVSVAIAATATEYSPPVEAAASCDALESDCGGVSRRERRRRAASSCDEPQVELAEACDSGVSKTKRLKIRLRKSRGASCDAPQTETSGEVKVEFGSSCDGT